MPSITNIIWGISNTAVEHPETCKIHTIQRPHSTPNPSCLTHHQLKGTVVPSVYLSWGPQLFKAKLLACRHHYTQIYRVCRNQQEKINLPPHLLFLLNKKFINKWPLICLVKKYCKIQVTRIKFFIIFGKANHLTSDMLSFEIPKDRSVISHILCF